MKLQTLTYRPAAKVLGVGVISSMLIVMLGVASPVLATDLNFELGTADWHSMIAWWNGYGDYVGSGDTSWTEPDLATTDNVPDWLDGDTFSSVYANGSTSKIAVDYGIKGGSYDYNEDTPWTRDTANNGALNMFHCESPAGQGYVGLYGVDQAAQGAVDSIWYVKLSPADGAAARLDSFRLGYVDGESGTANFTCNVRSGAIDGPIIRTYDINNLGDCWTTKNTVMSAPIAVDLYLEIIQETGDASQQGELTDLNVRLDDIKFSQALAGDADLDGDVDGDDLDDVRSNWSGDGSSGDTWADGDFDRDGDVDLVDMGILRANWTGPLNYYSALVSCNADGDVTVTANFLKDFRIYGADPADDVLAGTEDPNWNFITYSDADNYFEDDTPDSTGWSTDIGQTFSATTLEDVAIDNLNQGDLLYSYSRYSWDGQQEVITGVVTMTNPEPATVSLLALGTGILLRRRRR